MMMTSRRLIQIILIMLSPLFWRGVGGEAFSQTEEPTYPFINYAANKIVFSKDSSSMLGFYKKLNAFINGKENEVRIIHIGGSHVQGGMWGDELTADFQNINKTKGSGFFAFPFKIIKTNS